MVGKSLMSRYDINAIDCQERLVSEMTYSVSSEPLNSIFSHSCKSEMMCRFAFWRHVLGT